MLRFIATIDAAFPNEYSNNSPLTPYLIIIELVFELYICRAFKPGGLVVMEKHDIPSQSIGDRHISMSNGNTQLQFTEFSVDF